MTRPRLCFICHTPATWAVEETKLCSRITIDAQVIRFPMVENTYYCDDHVPVWL